MKNMKALAALAMAAAMATTGVSAFAAAPSAVTDTPAASNEDVESATGELAASGKTFAPTVKVNVPTSMDYILNPYQIKAKPQIISPKFDIKNLSDVPVNVMVAKCVPADDMSSDITLVAKAPTEKSTAKEAYIYLRATVIKTGVTDVDTAAAYSKASATTAGDVLAAKADAGATTAPVLLASLAASADGTTAAAEGGAAKGTFLGALSSPKETPWEDGDDINLTVTYNFVPQVNEIPAP